MMPAQYALTSSLVLLVLLSTARAGPFSSRSNVTLPAPRPPPQPGGRTVGAGGGSPSSQLYEHTVEGGEKQVIFTHRINLPPSTGCGCPPGTEPPVPASEVQALRVRLEILEELVKGLKEQCTGGCCPASAQAGTGQTDVRTLCSLHGVFDLSRCTCSCEPGWAGPTCSDPTDAEIPPSSPPSASGSCPDDCNDQGRCVRGRCVCFPGYTGPSCGWPSCPGDCQGRGRCVQGVCVCRAGFSGPDCSQRSCPRGCSQRGRCEDGRCVCDPGYTGEDCGVRSCPRSCSQRGRCENGRCVCNPGYTGEDCGVRSCPRGCSQRGRCEDGRCVCDPGYTGEDCGTRSCPWDCGEGGRCVDGRCVCWPGYTGEDCSTRTCPRDCRGRGRCEDGECICDTGYSGDDCGVRSCPGDCNQRGRCEDGRCVCWPGYTGPDCGSRACPRDCRGRGRCENGVCVCNAGYSGEDCGVRSCPGDCRGRGRCESGRCVCWPGYTGRDCGTRACPGDCRGRGRCVDGRCVCNPGFTGEDCGSRRCPGDCRGHGRCEDGVCVCDAGYSGEDCSTRSCPGGCQGRGQCLDGRCVCEDGYSGEDCGVRQCPNDCSQHGVCQDGVCICWEGYIGEDCSIRTCPSNCHGRGRCEEGRCLCNPGYTGPTCATRMCPADCWGRGRCVQGVCLCHVGYGGEDCGQEEPPASACPGGCGPRELCRAGQCVCVEGFRGPDCAIQTCPGDCRGRGECHDGSCVCKDGYAGEDCGEEVPTIEGMRMHLLEETTVRTEWTPAPGPVDAYEIQFIPTTEGASPPFTARVPSSASAYDQRGLAPGQEYQVTVRALRGTSWGLPASKTITTMIDGPQDLRVVAVTPTTLELGWLRPQAEVDRFVVSYVSAGNQRVRLEVPPEADGTLLTDLMPGVEYVVTVTAERGRAVSYPASVRANTGSSPSGLLGTTDEPPPSGPSTTQGAQAPLLQQRPQELGELRVLGRDETGRLHVVWTAQPDTFAHFQLRLRVPEGPGAHEEVLPGDIRQALVPPPPPGTPYELSLRGVPPGGKPSDPIIYQGIMDKDEEKPGKSSGPPRLGELTVTDRTSDSLLLRWTVPEGEFDSFVIQYKDRDGQPQVVPVEGPQRSAVITSLDPGRKYKFVLYGFVGKKRHGPLVAEAKMLPQSDPSPGTPPRLGNLWVTDPTPDSLHLSWTVPEGQFDTFMVQYRDRDGRPQVVPVEGPERSFVVSSLDPDHKYRFTLFGIANKKRYGPLTANGTTAPERKEEPPRPEFLEQPLLGELTVTGVTPDSLRLSWTVAQGPFDSFMVQYKDAQGQPQAVPVAGDENEVTVPGLDPDRKYKMNLYGLRGRQRVGPESVVAKTAPQEDVDETPSPTELATEAPEPPEEPLLGELTVTGSSPDSLSLSWTVPQGRFDSFTVQYKDRDGRPQAVRVGGEESEVTVGGLEPGHKYKMHLYGLHEGQRVGPVSAVGVTAPQQEETPPATESPLEPRLGELTVTDVTPNSVGLSWTVPEGQFDSFMVQYKDKDGQPQVMPVAADQREVTVYNLKYKMNMYGLHDGQRVGPLSVVIMTAPLPPAPATEASKPPLEPHLGELTVTDVTPDSVGLSWTVPEGEFDSFVVQYKDRDGQPQVVPVAADLREVTIPDLEPSRKYKFLLFGIQDGKRRSPVSVEAKTVARSDASPGAPPRLGELWVTDPTPDSLRLSWTVPEGQFNSFVVQFKDKDGPQVVPVEGHERSVTVTPLDAGRKYRFLLYGLLGKKRHGPLTADGTTEARSAMDDTGTKRPPKPRLGEELQVTSVTQNSVGLSWTVPEGQFDSFVVQYKDRDGQPQVVPVEGSLREVSVPSLEPAHRYKLLLYGLHGGKRVGPISAVAITASREEMETETTAPTPPVPEPHLGELTVEEATPHTLHLSWMVPEGEFDSFEIQYTDRDGQFQMVRTGGDRNDITLSGLESDHRYLVTLYGFHDGKHVGPVHVEALTVQRTAESQEPSEPPTATPEPPIKPRLGELTVTDATPDSLSLSWTVPEGQFDHFLVQYRNGDGQPKAVRVPGHEEGVTISGLEPDHKYKMNLYGFHSGQRVGPVSAIGVTAAEEETPSPTEPSTEPPEEPLLGELTVTGSSPDSLSLSWTVPQGRFDSFTVQYKDRDGKPQVVRVGGEESEVTMGGLEPGRKYKMHLYGLHEGQRVGPVSAVGVTAPEEESPDVPLVKPRLGEMTVRDVTSDSLSLCWTVPEGQFDHFLVQYKNGDGQPKAVRVPGHEDGVTISGLEPDHKYKMNLYGFHGGQRVGPVSAVGLTAPGKDEEMAPASTEPPTPEPPIKPRLEELTVTDATPDSLSLSWTVPEGQFDHFLVQYKNGDGHSKATRVPGHEDRVTISGLEPDHKYKMNLYGFHSGQRVGPVSAIGVTAAEEETPSPTEPSTEAPEAPEEPLLGELTVTGSSPDSLSLSWTVPQGHFDSFTVQYKDRDGRPQVVRVGGEENEVTVGGLEPGHKYKMHLYGLHEGRRRLGPVSAVGITAAEEETPSPTEPSTEAPEPPEEPLLGELTVTGSSPDSLSLSWTVPQGRFNSFTVQYKDREGQPQVVRVRGEENEVTVGGLEPGRKYKMHLYGLHEGRRVGPVSTVGVTEDEAETTQAVPTTTPEPPIKPRLGELTVTDATPDSLGLSWTVPEGQFDHFLVQYRNGDGQPKAVRLPGHEDGVTISGLEPDHKYKMNLYGFHSGQRVAAEEETPAPTEPSTEATEPPEEPLLGELTVTGSSPDSLGLSWTVPQGRFDSFTVQYKDRDGRPQVVRVGGKEKEVTVGGLEPGRKYKMHLYGLHEGRRVGPVSTVGVTAPEDEAETTQAVPTTTPEPPIKPRLGELTVTDATPDSLTLASPSFSPGPKDIPLTLSPSFSAAEEETPSPTEPSTEAPEPPEESLLGELTVTGSSPDSLSLSWTVPQGRFDSFTVQYKDRDGQPQVVRVGGEESEVTVGGLEPGRKYKMHLYGLHEGRRVGPVSTVGVTGECGDRPSSPGLPLQPPCTHGPALLFSAPLPTPPPVEPRLGELAVAAVTSDSVGLSWTVAQGLFDSFLVQYRDAQGQPQAVPVSGDLRAVTVSGLDPARKYKFLLFGLQNGKRHGPVPVEARTVGISCFCAPHSSPQHPLIYWVQENPGPELSSPTHTHPSPYFPCARGDTCFLVCHPPVPGTRSSVAPLPPSHSPHTKPSPRLGELTVTDATPDSVGLSWTVPEGEFDSFVVQHKDKDGRLQVVPVPADQREVTVQGLEPSRKYRFLLYGLSGRKRLGPISADSTTAPLEKEPPPRLGELTVTEETSSSLRLSWTVAQGPFDSFMVQYRDTDGQPRAVPVAADQRTVTIEDLEPGKKYKFLLYGLLGGKRLGPVSVLGMTAPEEDVPAPELAPEAPEPPEEPRLGVLTVTDTTPDSMRLSWSVAQGPFDSFVVQYEDTNGQPQALLVDGDQSKILISGLEPSTPYRFLLYGLHEGKRLGPLSAEGTTGPAPAGQTSAESRPRLSQLSVTDVTTSSLRLNWEAPPGAFDSFLLRFGVPSPSTLEPHPRPLLQRELMVPGTRHSAVLRDLRPGTLYSLTLYGLRGPHKADSIQGTARTLSPVLESPRDLQFSEIRETSAKVNWMPPPSRADSFKVSYQLADGGEPQSVQVDGQARTQKLQGLIPGARYEVTVVSVRGFEESEPLTGFLTTVPDGPTQLRALNLTEGFAVLHWKPPQNPVDTYDVQVTAPGAPPLQAEAPGSAVDYPLHDLVLHTNYTATVRGLRGPNLTSPASITFTTGLEAPRDLEAKEVTPRTALLTWTEPQVRPTGYLLSFDTPGGQTQEILLPGGITSHRLLGLFPSTPYNARLQAMWGQSLLPPVSTSFTTGGLRIPFPRDCGEEMQNGAGASRTSTIFLNGNRERPLNVFCDMETDGGGWLVFQRRMDGQTDFWRDWEDYAHGFGNISGEFWLGNEALHSLTQAGDYSMRVDLRAGDEAVFAQYDSFRVDSAAEYYRLHLEGYHGTAGDSMSYHSGSVFSARDRDPNNLLISCAVSYRGAWWYRNCHYANLNGLYGSTVDHQGVSWYYWKGFDFSVPFTEMKLRPRNFRSPAGGG
uniref:Tenascin XB n=1 Tax=Nomascus leucogenys TaxID=61853 RepID=G1R3P0_NOMLE